LVGNREARIFARPPRRGKGARGPVRRLAGEYSSERFHGRARGVDAPGGGEYYAASLDLLGGV